MGETIEISNSLVEVMAILTRKLAQVQSISIEANGFSDLTLRQIYYLDAVHSLKNPTPTELAGALGISKPSVSIALDRLEETGYVRKVQSDEDRRSYHVHLTTKGQAFSQVHEQVHLRLVQEVLEPLDAGERRQLSDLMEIVVRHLRSFRV
jgi:DNA-binding MarR family transcriptional regulator